MILIIIFLCIENSYLKKISMESYGKNRFLEKKLIVDLTRINNMKTNSRALSIVPNQN